MKDRRHPVTKSYRARGFSEHGWEVQGEVLLIAVVAGVQLLVVGVE